MIRIDKDEKNGFVRILGYGPAPLDILTVSRSGNILTISDPVLGKDIFVGPYTSLADGAGNTFASASAAETYVADALVNTSSGVGPQGPQGDPGPQGATGPIGPQGPAGTGLTSPLYSIFPVWAEENADASTAAGGYQYAYGNGDNAGSGNGVVMPFDVELIGLSIDTDGVSNAGVECRMSDSQGSTNSTILETVRTTNSRAGFKDLRSNPIAVPAGRTIGFRTNLVDPGSNGVRPCAWFRYQIFTP